jgi:hypothetical protein
MAINYMCKASEHDIPTEPLDPEARLTAILWHKDQRIAALERELAELSSRANVSGPVLPSLSSPDGALATVGAAAAGERTALLERAEVKESAVNHERVVAAGELPFVEKCASAFYGRAPIWWSEQRIWRMTEPIAVRVTWEDLRRQAVHCPFLSAMLEMQRRGTWADPEEALLWVALMLSEARIRALDDHARTLLANESPRHIP